MQKIDLYTIHYDKNLPVLDGWTPYFCHGHTQERETWHFRDFLRNKYFDGYLGLFSPSYYPKLELSASEIRDIINVNSGFDCYIFNPFPLNSYSWYNVWEQGFSNHGGLKARTIYLFQSLGISTNELKTRDSRNEVSFCNYIIANSYFWNTYLKFLAPFQDFVDAEEGVGPLFNICPYEFSRVSYIPFIFERLLAIFLKNNSNLKVMIHNTLDLPVEFTRHINLINRIDDQVSRNDPHFEIQMRKAIRLFNEFSSLYYNIVRPSV